MSYFVADFNRVALSVGPLELRWYALAYVVGFFLSLAWMRLQARRSPHNISAQNIGDFLAWGVLGVVVGGRLGYVLFYNPQYYIANPAEIVMLWHGGMAFHGGFAGLLVAMWLYCRKHSIKALAMGDLLACGTPLGLCLGRVANFINGELWGHPSELPWAVIFPLADEMPRHPSQIYEAFLEGIVIFIIINLLAWRGALYKTGFLSGMFMLLYGIFRIIVEEFRVSDSVPAALENILIFGYWGQWLSVPMVLIGLAMVAVTAKRKHHAATE